MMSEREYYEYLESERQFRADMAETFLWLAVTIGSFMSGIVLPIAGEQLFAYLAGHRTSDTTDAYVPLTIISLACVTFYIVSAMKFELKPLVAVLCFQPMFIYYLFSIGNMGSTLHWCFAIVYSAVFTLTVMGVATYKFINEPWAVQPCDS